MRDATLRQKKDDLMVPMARRLFGSVHPNVISFVAMAVGLMTILAIINQLYVVGLILWLLNRVLDGLDGVIARVHDKQSDFGAYLDLLLDFVIYLAIPIAFLWVAPTQINLWAGIALLAAYVINLLSWTTLSALLEKRRHQSAKRLTSMEMPSGLIEGTETILFYCLFFIVPSYLAVLYAAMAALVFFTAGQRVWWAYRNLS